MLNGVFQRPYLNKDARNLVKKKQDEEKIKPVEIIKNLEAPTLFIAGKKDPTVCPWHTDDVNLMNEIREKLSSLELLG